MNQLAFSEMEIDWANHFGEHTKFDQNNWVYVDTPPADVLSYIMGESKIPHRVFLIKLPTTEFESKLYLVQYQRVLTQTLAEAYTSITPFDSWRAERLFTDRVKNINLAIYALINAMSPDYSAVRPSNMALESPYQMDSDEFYWRRRVQGLVLNVNFTQRLIGSQLEYFPRQAMYWESP